MLTLSTAACIRSGRFSVTLYDIGAETVKHTYIKGASYQREYVCSAVWLKAAAAELSGCRSSCDRNVPARQDDMDMPTGGMETALRRGEGGARVNGREERSHDTCANLGH